MPYYDDLVDNPDAPDGWWRDVTDPATVEQVAPGLVASAAITLDGERVLWLHDDRSDVP